MERATREPSREPESEAAQGRPFAAALTPGSRTWASAVGNRAVQRYARQMIARLTPQEILERYQVHEDTTVEWGPSAFGAIPIPFTETRVITATEGRSGRTTMGTGTRFATASGTRC